MTNHDQAENIRLLRDDQRDPYFIPTRMNIMNWYVQCMLSYLLLFLISCTFSHCVHFSDPHLSQDYLVGVQQLTW